MLMKTIVLYALLFCATAAHAQTKVDQLLYQAYLQRSKSLWITALQTQQAESKKAPTDFEKQLTLAQVYSSVLNGSMALPDEEFFDAHVDDAKKLTKKLLDQNQKSGVAAAILSGIYGNEMGYSPMKGMMLGSKSSSLAEKATVLEPTSPWVWRIYANNKFYTPEAFGGDIAEAIKALEKSVMLFESDPKNLSQNWMYIDALAFLGQAYQKNGEQAKAIAVYEKALTVEPNFSWVKKVLLPAAQKKASN
jgi:tetratricopeptide (TPR) repeat protein